MAREALRCQRAEHELVSQNTLPSAFRRQRMMTDVYVCFSVERIREYINIHPEAPTEIPEARPPANWPSEGSVELVHYSTRYRDDLPFALKDINLTIQPGEKIAIVGRTGAGKTSLTAALFRGLEATEGKILIDGIDISTIGLHDLRRSITIVPQGKKSLLLFLLGTKFD